MLVSILGIFLLFVRHLGLGQYGIWLHLCTLNLIVFWSMSFHNILTNRMCQYHCLELEKKS